MRGHAGKVAVVTGAAQGIGQAYARRLAEDGVDVVAADRVEPTETVEAIRAAGRRALGFVGDVSRPETAEQLLEAVIEELGQCDILVNNVGIYPMARFEELTFDDWRHMFAVNLDSMFLLCRTLLPGMRVRGWGRIVNQSSDVVNLHVTDGVHYVASKAGVVGLTRALASEVGKDGVTVNAIAPSLVKTPTTMSATSGPAGRTIEQLHEDVANSQAIKRVSTPEDLVGALSFLTSDESAFITGQVLFVDGGLVRGG